MKIKIRTVNREKYIVFEYSDELYQHVKSYKIGKISNKKLGQGVEINFVDSSAPTFSLKFILEIASFFGTEDIDFNDSIAVEGCPTCGSGGEYGYRIQIYKITKNYPY